MKEVQLKYRNGFPSKKSMRDFLESYDEEFWAVGLSYNWGHKNNKHSTLTWQRESIQNKIESFIEYASNYGIVFGEYDPYRSPRVGHLQILKKT